MGFPSEPVSVRGSWDPSSTLAAPMSSPIRISGSVGACGSVPSGSGGAQVDRRIDAASNRLAARDPRRRNWGRGSAAKIAEGKLDSEILAAEEGNDGLQLIS